MSFLNCNCVYNGKFTVTTLKSRFSRCWKDSKPPNGVFFACVRKVNRVVTLKIKQNYIRPEDDAEYLPCFPGHCREYYIAVHIISLPGGRNVSKSETTCVATAIISRKYFRCFHIGT